MTKHRKPSTFGMSYYELITLDREHVGTMTLNTLGVGALEIRGERLIVRAIEGGEFWAREAENTPKDQHAI